MSKSIFLNAFDRITAAREMQARRYVGSILLYLDDETLKSLGHSREDLKKAGQATLPFWTHFVVTGPASAGQSLKAVLLCRLLLSGW